MEKVPKDKMQSLYSQVGLYELPFTPQSSVLVPLQVGKQHIGLLFSLKTQVPSASANMGIKPVIRSTSQLDYMQHDVMFLY